MSDEVRFRPATADDLGAIVDLLAADPLGSQREDPSRPLAATYGEAFESVDSDPNQELVVGVSSDGDVAAVAQLTFIPSLTYQGSWRAQIEGVRVAERVRSSGVGRRMIEHCVDRARARGCLLVQLTTDKRRPRALAFYESLGFVASHEGMKLRLD